MPPEEQAKFKQALAARGAAQAAARVRRGGGRGRPARGADAPSSTPPCARRGCATTCRPCIDERGLVVSLVSQHVVFEPDVAELSARGIEVVDTIAPVLRRLDDPLQIDGHTNQVKVKPKYYPTDWELSAARAVTVLRHLHDVGGIPNERMTASAFGHEKPLIDPSKPGSQRDQQARRHRRRVRPARRDPGPAGRGGRGPAERYGGIPVSTTTTAPPTEEAAEDEPRKGGKLKKILILVVLLAVVGGAVLVLLPQAEAGGAAQAGRGGDPRADPDQPGRRPLPADRDRPPADRQGGAGGRRQQGPGRDDRESSAAARWRRSWTRRSASTLKKELLSTSSRSSTTDDVMDVYFTEFVTQ